MSENIDTMMSSAKRKDFRGILRSVIGLLLFIGVAIYTAPYLTASNSSTATPTPMVTSTSVSSPSSVSSPQISASSVPTVTVTQTVTVQPTPDNSQDIQIPWWGATIIIALIVGFVIFVFWFLIIKVFGAFENILG